MTTIEPVKKLIDFGNTFIPDEVQNVNQMYMWQYSCRYIPGTATRVWFHYEPSQLTFPRWKQQLLGNNLDIEFVDITLNMLYGEFFDDNNQTQEENDALKLFTTVESIIFPIANGIVAYQVINNKHYIGFMSYNDKRMDMTKEYIGDNNRISWNADMSIFRRNQKLSE